MGGCWWRNVCEINRLSSWFSSLWRDMSLSEIITVSGVLKYRHRFIFFSVSLCHSFGQVNNFLHTYLPESLSQSKHSFSWPLNGACEIGDNYGRAFIWVPTSKCLHDTLVCTKVFALPLVGLVLGCFFLRDSYFYCGILWRAGLN